MCWKHPAQNGRKRQNPQKKKQTVSEHRRESRHSACSQNRGQGRRPAGRPPIPMPYNNSMSGEILRIQKIFSPGREQRMGTRRHKKHRVGNRNVIKLFPGGPGLRRNCRENPEKTANLPAFAISEKSDKRIIFKRVTKLEEFYRKKCKKTLAFNIISWYIKAASQKGRTAGSRSGMGL